jgi:electron transfer flavoprotein alpha subunit
MRKVWIVLQQRDGKLHRMSREAIAAGVALAEATGAAAEAVLLGQDVAGLARELARTPLAALRVADHPALAAYTPGAYVGALAPALAAEAPDLVVFPHTYQTVDYLARLAFAVGGTLVPEIVGFGVADGGLLWRRPVLGGKLQATVRAKGPAPVLLSVQAGAFAPIETAGSEVPIRALAVDPERAVPDREILGVEEVAGEQLDLSAASVIVAVGRGIGEKEKMGIVEELAAALGAEIGASRPVIDNGWLPRDRQIGSSGQTVAPKLYLALGISGAIQHLVGMKGSQVVVAINKDASAPIFSVARYGIVGDLHEVVPALTAALREAGEA